MAGAYWTCSVDVDLSWEGVYAWVGPAGTHFPVDQSLKDSLAADTRISRLPGYAFTDETGGGGGGDTFNVSPVTFLSMGDGEDGADSLIPGPPGQTGATGAQGSQGSQGIQGTTGPQGSAGPAGLPGFGFDGEDGADSLVPGPQGPAGATGATGGTGSQGAQGNPGAQGASGPAGPALFLLNPEEADPGIPIPGPVGQTGAAGSAGAKGDTGSAGATGPAGQNGAALFLLHDEEADPGIPIPGPAGATGATGAPGAGASWTVASVALSPGTYNDSSLGGTIGKDVWIQVSNGSVLGDIYFTGFSYAGMADGDMFKIQSGLSGHSIILQHADTVSTHRVGWPGAGAVDDPFLIPPTGIITFFNYGGFWNVVGAVPAYDHSATSADIGNSAAGTSSWPSHEDHVHATGAGTPTTQAFGDSAAVGSGPAAAMTDHKHGMPANPFVLGTTPSTQAIGDAAAGGSATTASKNDHKHGMPSAQTIANAAAASSFPGSPTSGDRVFRTDLGMEFYYDGTHWLTTQVFDLTLENTAPGTSDLVGIGSTTTAVQRTGIPSLHGGSDLWLLTHELTFDVSGGTALGASHKWVGVFGAFNSTLVVSTIATDNLSSGASSTLRKQTDTINALLSTTLAIASCFGFQTNWTKTGTPGALLSWEKLTYRIVAT